MAMRGSTEAGAWKYVGRQQVPGASPPADKWPRLAYWVRRLLPRLDRRSRLLRTG